MHRTVQELHKPKIAVKALVADSYIDDITAVCSRRCDMCGECGGLRDAKLLSTCCEGPCCEGRPYRRSSCLRRAGLRARRGVVLAAAAKRLLIRSEIDLCNFNIRIGVGIQIVNFKRSEGGRVRDQGGDAG